MNPKAFLVTASESLEDLIQKMDEPHVYKISRLSYLVESKGGFYLIGDLSKDIDKDFCAAPIFDSIIGHFFPEARHWLESHGIEIHHSRA